MEPTQRQATIQKLNQSKQQLEEVAAATPQREVMSVRPEVISRHPHVEVDAGVRGREPEVIGRQEVTEDFLNQDLIREVESCNQLIDEMSARTQKGKDLQKTVQM